jgi:hypothetical protein
LNDRRAGGPATSPETSAGTVSRETGLASAHRCTLDRPAGTKGRAREDKEEGEPGATGEGEVVAGPGVGAGERLVGREGRGRAPGQRRREGEAESRGAIGALIVASILQIIMGFSGLWDFVSTHCLQIFLGILTVILCTDCDALL